MVESRSPVLDEALKRWLPMPASETEGIHAAYLLIEPREPGQSPVVLACAVDRACLEGQITPMLLTASPAAFPEAIATRLGGKTPSPESINLLVGDLQPRVVLSLRRRTQLVTVATVLMALGLAVLGSLAVPRRMKPARPLCWPPRALSRPVPFRKELHPLIPPAHTYCWPPKSRACRQRRTARQNNPSPLMPQLRWRICSPVGLANPMAAPQRGSMHVSNPCKSSQPASR